MNPRDLFHLICHPERSRGIPPLRSPVATSGRDDISVKILFCLLTLFFQFTPTTVQAAETNAITPVFIVRDRQYWRQGKDLSHLTKITDFISEKKLPSTILIHYDTLFDSQIVEKLKSLPPTTEIGLFLEVTRRLAEDSQVYYHWATGEWSQSNRLFLSGYDVAARKRLIDKFVSRYQSVFGTSPKSSGAWHTDLTSLQYLKDKYAMKVNLGLADQYSTDGYQVWGQYLNQPYYISRTSPIEPALNQEDNTGIVKLQWAPRHPFLSFGTDVHSSNFSAQVNDYYRGKSLPFSYFTDFLKDNLTNLRLPLAQLVIGIEVSELEPIYYDGLDQQLDSLLAPDLHLYTMSDFARQYQETYPQTPSFELVSTSGPATRHWYFTPQYRLCLRQQDGQTFIDDLRFYHQSNLTDKDTQFADTYPNLHRVIPAVIDAVSTGASVPISSDAIVSFQPHSLVFSSFAVLPEVLQPLSTVSDSGQVIVTPDRLPHRTPLCHQDAGWYSSPFSCLKDWLVKLLPNLPDVRFAKLSDGTYVGLRTSPESIFAVRLPKLRIGSFNYPYQSLQDFRSLDKLRIPKFSFIGKEELYLDRFKGLGYRLINKFATYGQENITNQKPSGIVAESNYYWVVKD